MKIAVTMKNTIHPLQKNNNSVLCILVISFFLFSACSVSKSSFSLAKKYSPAQLQKDYSVFRGALEESHTGIYWYTSKEEMDGYFAWGENQLKDSMNEEGFRKILSYVVSKINCGHTVVRSSKAFSKYRDSGNSKIFPLSVKIWSGKTDSDDDTVTVAANLNGKDSPLKRGIVIKKINNRPLNTIIDTLSRYISSDGYNFTHKFQTLSNRGGFGSLYTSVLGLKENYHIDYVDESGIEKSTDIPVYNTKTDTINRVAIARFTKATRTERKQSFRKATRNLRMDSLNKIAFMDLGSFGHGLTLKHFFRTSFRSLRHADTKDLVIDVRGNGGGSVTNSTLLTKFIIDKKFKVADSLYANTRKSHYKKHIENYFINRLFMLFMTAKKEDGKYHFGYFERHYFHPKSKNHFNGNVYILTGGNSFSATTLFAQSVRNQDNVTLVGEETGGGSYGNTAWLIPDVTLPNTKVKFRLPLFRLVINKNNPKTGKGVQPEVEVKPTVDAIRRGVDYKMDKVIELIKAHQ